MFDLFCGPGGFSTGFEWAGFRSQIGVDIHEPSVRTFARMHPEAQTFHVDIRALGPAEVLRAAGGETPTVLTAGIPCEGFSRSNRNRNRFVDARNFLFLEFLRFAEALQPRVAIIENVSALRDHSEGFFRDEIVQGLEALGYSVQWKILNAADYGVPQRRRRLFFVGVEAGLRFTWPAPTHGGEDLAPRTVGEAIEDLPRIGPGESAERYEEPPRDDYQRFLREGQGEVLLNHIAPKHPQATIDKIANTAQGEPMYPRFKQRIRLHPDRPSPTVVSGGIRPQFVHGHPWEPRGLTVRERARLQSFPDSYCFEGGVVQGRVQTGDAVPPLLAWHVAEQVKGAMEVRTDPESEPAAPAEAVLS
jgi:DNA (cytosine-5)-methyltransferase 1